jgi:hypothetical protein
MRVKNNKVAGHTEWRYETRKLGKEGLAPGSVILYMAIAYGLYALPPLIYTPPFAARAFHQIHT